MLLSTLLLPIFFLFSISLESLLVSNSAVSAVPTAVDVTSNIPAVIGIPAVANIPDVANVSMPSSPN